MATLLLTVAVITTLALLGAGKASAQVSKRPLSDFISTQGTTVNWWPPLSDYVGWSEPANNTFALVDYAGIANTWIKANGGPDLGTTVTGSVFEEALPDGRAEVTVTLTTVNAMGFASALDPWGELWLGRLAQDVAAGAAPAVGSSYFHVVFVNTAPGAPLPNICQAMNLGVQPPGFEMVSVSFMADVRGPLRVEAGMGPEGTAGRVTVAQMGIYTPTNQDGIWPVESLNLQITAPRQRLYVWVYPRSVKQGTPNYLRSYVRRLPELSWLPNLPISFTLDGTSLGWETTDMVGRASHLYSVPADWPFGDHTLVCTFAGDALYQPGVGSATIACIP